MTAAKPLARAGFAGKRGFGWVLLASWLIPAIMTAAYIFLMYTSETDNTGKAWESVGLGFVFVLWFLFRVLTEHAAISRAVVVGDAARVLELADHQLRRWHRAGVRARLHVCRALAFEIRGEWASALAALDRPEVANAAATWRHIAATVRVAALVETGRVADARAAYDAILTDRLAMFDSTLAPLARLAEGRLRWAEGDLDGAAAVLAKLVDDVRAGAGTRGAAHHYAALVAEARGDAAAAARHHARAAELAPASWVAREPE